MIARWTHPWLPLLIALLGPSMAAAWVLDLPDSVTVRPGNVCVADLARGEVPASSAAIVLAPGLQPGSTLSLTRSSVLRRLVMAGQATGVQMRGAQRCQIRVAGQTIAAGELEAQVTALLASRLPAVAADAPDSWLDVTVPRVAPVGGSWTVSWPKARPLVPGRNLVTLTVSSPRRTQRISVTATVHAFARTPQAVAKLARGQEVAPEAVSWVWTDLARCSRDVITDPAGLQETVLVRDVAPGEAITASDLKAVPLVQRGEPIDLVVARGGTRAVVRAECRQDGRLGQIVSVFNPITRCLVVARVTAPGVVTMGR